MPGFFLTFLACFVLTLAGREQLRVARLAGALGPRVGLFVAVLLSSVITSGVAAWLGTLIAPSLASAAKQMFLAIALLLAALELLILRARPAPREPTWSFGAILIILLAAHMTDAARFMVMALAVQTGEPAMAGAGGTLGSGLALSVAILSGADWDRRIPHRKLTYGVAGLLFLLSALIGLSARGIIN